MRGAILWLLGVAAVASLPLSDPPKTDTDILELLRNARPEDNELGDEELKIPAQNVSTPVSSDPTNEATTVESVPSIEEQPQGTELPEQQQEEEQPLEKEQIPAKLEEDAVPPQETFPSAPIPESEVFGVDYVIPEEEEERPLEIEEPVGSFVEQFESPVDEIVYPEVFGAAEEIPETEETDVYEIGDRISQDFFPEQQPMGIAEEEEENADDEPEVNEGEPEGYPVDVIVAEREEVAGMQEDMTEELSEGMVAIALEDSEVEVPVDEEEEGDDNSEDMFVAPEDAPEQYFPEDAPEQYFSEDAPEQYSPEDAPEQYFPEDAPEQYFPEGTPEQYFPEDAPEQYSPEDAPEQYFPEDTPEQYSPEDAPEQYFPEDAPEQYSPEDAPEQYSPEDAPEQYFPEDAPQDYYPEILFGAPEDAPEEMFGVPEDASEEMFGTRGEMFGAPVDAPEELFDAPEDAPEEMFGTPGEMFGAPEGAPVVFNANEDVPRDSFVTYEEIPERSENAEEMPEEAGSQGFFDGRIYTNDDFVPVLYREDPVEDPDYTPQEYPQDETYFPQNVYFVPGSGPFVPQTFIPADYEDTYEADDRFGMPDTSETVRDLPEGDVPAPDYFLGEEQGVSQDSMPDEENSKGEEQEPTLEQNPENMPTDTEDGIVVPSFQSPMFQEEGEEENQNFDSNEPYMNPIKIVMVEVSDIKGPFSEQIQPAQIPVRPIKPIRGEIFPQIKQLLPIAVDSQPDQPMIVEEPFGNKPSENDTREITFPEDPEPIRRLPIFPDQWDNQRHFFLPPSNDDQVDFPDFDEQHENTEEIYPQNFQSQSMIQGPQKFDGHFHAVPSDFSQMNDEDTGASYPDYDLPFNYGPSQDYYYPLRYPQPYGGYGAYPQSGRNPDVSQNFQLYGPRFGSQMNEGNFFQEPFGPRPFGLRTGGFRAPFTQGYTGPFQTPRYDQIYQGERSPSSQFAPNYPYPWNYNYPSRRPGW